MKLLIIVTQISLLRIPVLALLPPIESPAGSTGTSTAAVVTSVIPTLRFIVSTLLLLLLLLLLVVSTCTCTTVLLLLMITTIVLIVTALLRRRLLIVSTLMAIVVPSATVVRRWWWPTTRWRRRSATNRRRWNPRRRRGKACGLWRRSMHWGRWRRWTATNSGCSRNLVRWFDDGHSHRWRGSRCDWWWLGFCSCRSSRRRLFDLFAVQFGHEVHIVRVKFLCIRFILASLLLRTIACWMACVTTNGTSDS
mmetsp:Transcript_40489/g.60009  ORF Transcript_40489/g.60009 Transcript_40489/m.60009 type:complete len:251 (-) Transcript_40489:1242-1994(-)